MNILKNISLKRYNTFGIEAKAKHFIEISDLEELCLALQLDEYPVKFIISGGSNMLITRNIDALVLYINIKGIKVNKEEEDAVVLTVNAGENWHDLVLWTMKHNYGGLENLSLIPGNTGTAPIQNIGAYGVELKDVFESCEAIEVKTQKLVHFSKQDCKFGYRDSYFKNEGRDAYIITSVNIKLSKNNHILNTAYGDIETELQKENTLRPTIQDVSNAVIAIRKSKLPDPNKIGNSGSFFKNPVLTLSEFENFSRNHPDVPYYRVSKDLYKIPAGWLIEQCGFKGKRIGDAGVHNKQALVLVNYGNASGAEILALANEIQENVQKQFGILITPEVNIVA